MSYSHTLYFIKGTQAALALEVIREEIDPTDANYAEPVEAKHEIGVSFRTDSVLNNGQMSIIQSLEADERDLNNKETGME